MNKLVPFPPAKREQKKRSRDKGVGAGEYPAQRESS